MITAKQESKTNHDLWSCFKFSIIGPLLSSPPKSGELKSELKKLSTKTWVHPINGRPCNISVPTLERWYYKAKSGKNPIDILRRKKRSDSFATRKFSTALKNELKKQYDQHPSWSCQLHLDNLAVIAGDNKDLFGPVPSYSTLHRYMRSMGFDKKRQIKNTKLQQKYDKREVRSFEVEYNNSLWHLDFHHCSRKIVDSSGKWFKPLLLAVLDDHSRIICHAQWYLDESAESLIHGFKQALQKRGLPRALMTDNGSAMISSEFTGGLERLSILHETTLPYSPYQNAKQEVFWAQLEGRLMAMIESYNDLSLDILNKCTSAWVELEYHRKVHSEISTSPINRYVDGKSVARECPDNNILDRSFTRQVLRRQRKSDGTFTLDGVRFEVPGQYRHMHNLTLRYQHWDLSSAMLMDPNTNNDIAKLYPLDKKANANAMRRQIIDIDDASSSSSGESDMAPLIKDLLSQYAQTGLPFNYIPQSSKGEKE